jgi:hypothetical protein
MALHGRLLVQIPVDSVLYFTSFLSSGSWVSKFSNIQEVLTRLMTHRFV